MMDRREALKTLGTGFGVLGLAQLMQQTSWASNPQQVKPTHFPARAKHIIFLFLNGGPSQVDTFDPKPLLQKYHGKALPTGNLKTERKTGNVLASPFSFKRCGNSGLEISDIFPRLGDHADDLCVIRSMHTNMPNHTQGMFMMNLGSLQVGRPSLGSWLSYGLGTENQNLPGFVVLCPGVPVMGNQNWSSAFLPGVYQGTHIPNQERSIEGLIPHIRNTAYSTQGQREQLELLEKMNRKHLGRTGPDAQLEASIQSMEIAYRMQAEAPEVFDLSKEPELTRSRYGDSDFGRGCLMARRLVERGVRMVQLYAGDGQPWDNHDDILIHHKLAVDADPAISALLHDLKSSGLFQETVVLIGGEFGRTPVVESGGAVKVQYGRDHNNHGFSMVLAGAGVKGGLAYGATDDFGFKAADKPVHVHDLHATLLHLMGLDHTRLTYRYSGRDFRLTDVEGNVVKDILV